MQHNAMLICLLLGLTGDPIDSKSLQGKWVITEHISDGATNDDFIGIEVEIRGDVLSYVEEEEKCEFSFKIDAKKNPRHIDLTSMGQDDDGKTYLGVYELEVGTLTLCISEVPDSKNRPKKFEAPKGSSATLCTLSRVSVE